MASVIIQCLLVLCLVCAAMADCYDEPLHQRRNRDGQLEEFCLTRELKPQKIPIGKTENTDDCYRCTCSRWGLRCCGFGIKKGDNAQRVTAPPGCMLVVDGCNYYFLDIVTMQYC